MSETNHEIRDNFGTMIGYQSNGSGYEQFDPTHITVNQTVGGKRVNDTPQPSPAIDPLAEARKLVEADKDARGKACMAEIKDVLAKHKCQMRIDVTIGEQAVPLASVLAFPGKLAIIPD